MSRLLATVGMLAFTLQAAPVTSMFTFGPPACCATAANEDESAGDEMSECSCCDRPESDGPSVQSAECHGMAANCTCLACGHHGPSAVVRAGSASRDVAFIASAAIDIPSAPADGHARDVGHVPRTSSSNA